MYQNYWVTLYEECGTSDSESDVDVESIEQSSTQVATRGRKPELIGLNDLEMEALENFVSLRDKLKNIVTKFHQSPQLTASMIAKQIER